MNLTLGAVVKNEFVDLLDWVAYHRAVGIKHFSIADDRSFDGTLELLEALAYVLPLSLVRGFDRRRSPQQSAYKMIMESTDRKLCLFLDADEYLHSSNTNDSASILEKLFEDETVSAVGLNWQFIGNEGEWVSKYGSQIRHDGIASDDIFSGNFHLKSAVRISDVQKMVIHHAILKNGSYLLANGSKHKKLGPFSEYVVHEPVKVLHFASNGSYENFLIRRAWRADGDHPKKPLGAGKANHAFYASANPIGETFSINKSLRSNFEQEWNELVQDLKEKTPLFQELHLKQSGLVDGSSSVVNFEVTSPTPIEGKIRIESLVGGEAFASVQVPLQNGAGVFQLEIHKNAETEIRIQGSLSGRLVLTKKGAVIVEDQKFAELTFRLARAERLLLEERMRAIELEKSVADLKEQAAQTSKPE